jgi:hypothetical protein
MFAPDAKVASPVIVPPALGKAALAVVVVDVKTPFLAAMSTPSTVPDNVRFPDGESLIFSTPPAVPPVFDVLPNIHL